MLRFILLAVVWGAIVAFAGIVLLFAGVFRMESKRAENAARVIVTIDHDPVRCPVATPILITVRNEASKPVMSMTVTLSAHKPRHSSDIVTGGTIDSDRIILPGESYASCYPVPKLREAVPPDQLQWTGEYYARF